MKKIFAAILVTLPILALFSSFWCCGIRRSTQPRESKWLAWD